MIHEVWAFGQYCLPMLCDCFKRKTKKERTVVTLTVENNQVQYGKETFTTQDTKEQYSFYCFKTLQEAFWTWVVIHITEYVIYQIGTRNFQNLFFHQLKKRCIVVIVYRDQQMLEQYYDAIAHIVYKCTCLSYSCR